VASIVGVSTVDDGFVLSDCAPVSVVVLDDVASAGLVEPADGEVSDGLDEVDPLSSATAIPGVEATAAQTPNATASAPTRPTYCACPITPPPGASRGSTVAKLCNKLTPLKQKCGELTVFASVYSRGPMV
jgi:hypothetical protein